MKETKALKTPEEMAAYFKAMPKKKQENPYWGIEPGTIAQILDKGTEQPICFDASAPLFQIVRNFFRRYYESFGSEAQVLFVEPSDAASLSRLGIPVLTEGFLGTWLATAVVLPQDNHMGTSVISEAFWQERIVNAGIKPIARMHSHHVLSPYQSATDYASLIPARWNWSWAILTRSPSISAIGWMYRVPIRNGIRSWRTTGTGRSRTVRQWPAAGTKTGCSFCDITAGRAGK